MSVQISCELSCFSPVWLFVTPWTVACQALPMIFPRQEYWSGLSFLSPGDLPASGIEPASLMSPALEGRFFTTCTTWAFFFFFQISLWHEQACLTSLPHRSYWDPSFCDDLSSIWAFLVAQWSEESASVGDMDLILGSEDPLEEEMTTHSSILTWKIPWQKSLAGYSRWGCQELDMTEWLGTHSAH